MEFYFLYILDKIHGTELLKIIKLYNSSKKITVDELCEKCSISLSTYYRRIKLMEEIIELLFIIDTIKYNYGSIDNLIDLLLE